MKFNIYTENGSGMKFSNKEEFLHELSLMIDDCEANGGSFFTTEVYADASCFLIEQNNQTGDNWFPIDGNPDFYAKLK